MHAWLRTLELIASPEKQNSNFSARKRDADHTMSLTPERAS
jgi:hypothetical protein